MNKVGLMSQRGLLGVVVAACCVALSGCIYEVPITAKPTRKVDARLLGDWASKDGKTKMKVVKLDESNYIVSYDGELYRAYHSEVADTPFVTVQVLDSDKLKYAYFAWKLSDDGKGLTLRPVNDKVVPDGTKDSASVRKLLKSNLQNPKLFGEEVQFTKGK